MNISKSSFTVGLFDNTGFSAKKDTELSKIGESFIKNKLAEKSEAQIKTDEMCEQLEKIRNSNKCAIIDTKLTAGSELSNAELNFLKENNPQLYQKAMEIKAERELYRNTLESCQTKDDVQMMHLQKITSLADSVNRIKDNPNISDEKKEELCKQIQRRSMALQDEFMKYTSTKKYRDLPTRTEVIEGKRKPHYNSFFPALPKDLYFSIKNTDKEALLSAYSSDKTEKFNQKA